MSTLPLLVGVTAGALLATQAPINAELARGLGSPLAAAAVNFVVGGVVLVVLAALTSGGVAPRWAEAPAWTYLAGGCLGASFVTTSILLVPRLGASTLIALMVAGQLIAGLVLDHYGWLGLAQREITPGRLAGAGLLLAGVGLLRFG